MRPPPNHGLTLFELLITIGIIAMLIAILIPTTTTVRNRAKVTVCAANLRQIGQAIQAYRSELKRWPDACPIPAPFVAPGWPGSMRALPGVMSAYLPARSGVYRCRGDDEIFPQCAAEAGGFGISYFYTLPIYDAESQRPDPDETILTDFQGYAGKDRRVDVGEFHPPRRGMNALKIDGSVAFGRGNGH